jgi:hypothetical protein
VGPHALSLMPDTGGARYLVAVRDRGQDI